MVVPPPTEEEMFTPEYWQRKGRNASMFNIMDWIGVTNEYLEDQVKGLEQYFTQHPDKARHLPPEIRNSLTEIGVRLPG